MCLKTQKSWKQRKQIRFFKKLPDSMFCLLFVQRSFPVLSGEFFLGKALGNMASLIPLRWLLNIFNSRKCLNALDRRLYEYSAVFFLAVTGKKYFLSVLWICKKEFFFPKSNFFFASCPMKECSPRRKKTLIDFPHFKDSISKMTVCF